MTTIKRQCPRCGHESEEYRNPVPTVDIIIEIGNVGIVLVRRKNTPVGWALPGGFVDYGGPWRGRRAGRRWRRHRYRSP